MEASKSGIELKKKSNYVKPLENNEKCTENLCSEIINAK